MAAIAVLLMAGGFLALASESETDAFHTNVVGDSTYVEKGKSVTFTITRDRAYPFEGILLDSDGKQVASVAKVTDGGSSLLDMTRTITAPSTAGDYWFQVRFFSITDGSALVSQAKVPLKVVDPIVLKATLKNTGGISVTLNVFFAVDGDRMAGSDTKVTIPAGESKDVTYHYVTSGFSGNHSFYVDSDDTGMIGAVEGLGPSHSVSFYSQDVNHDWMNYLMVIVVVILILVLIYVYRKPVKNYGKPKGRRR